MRAKMVKRLPALARARTKRKDTQNWVLFVVATGTLLSAAAGSMVNVALPSIGRDLNVTLSDSRWIVQGFLLGVAVTLLQWGRASDMLGHGRLYLVGIGFFSLAALACGLVTSFAWLVFFRVVQAFGAGMAMATGPALVTTSVLPKRRGRAMGILSTSTYVGLTVGPPAAGAIVSVLDWRWIFFLNVPVGVIIIALGLKLLPPKMVSDNKGKFDWAGGLALMAALPLLLLALSEGPRGTVPPGGAYAMAGAGIAGLVGFVAWQRRSGHALLDLGLFRSRLFTGAVLSALGNYVALFMIILMMPFYLEEALGLTPKQSGMVLSVQPLVMALVAAPSGWLSDHWGSRGPATLGMLVLAAGLVFLALPADTENIWLPVAALAVVGLGTGMFISPNSSALMGAAPKRLQGVAGAIMAQARILGMLLGVAVATTLFHILGGRTGAPWGGVELRALRLVLFAAAGVALISAAMAAMRGSKRS